MNICIIFWSIACSKSRIVNGFFLWFQCFHHEIHTFYPFLYKHKFHVVYQALSWNIVNASLAKSKNSVKLQTKKGLENFTQFYLLMQACKSLFNLPSLRGISIFHFTELSSNCDLLQKIKFYSSMQLCWCFFDRFL